MLVDVLPSKKATVPVLLTSRSSRLGVKRGLNGCTACALPSPDEPKAARLLVMLPLAVQQHLVAAVGVGLIPIPTLLLPHAPATADTQLVDLVLDLQGSSGQLLC